MQLQLFRLYHNEREIDEAAEELNKKNTLLEKETKKRDRIEEEIKEKKREQGKVGREFTKVEQQIKESVSNCYLLYVLYSYTDRYVLYITSTIFNI